MDSTLSTLLPVHRDLVLTALSRLDLSESHLTNSQIKPAASEGDNMMSTVHRIILGDTSLVLKVTLTDPRIREVFNCRRLYRNEIAMYELILPMFKNVNAPKCYATLCDGEHDALVLEDLSLTGYRTVEREEGLDGAHAKLVLGELAKFHAASLNLKLTNLNLFRKLSHEVAAALYCDHLRSIWSPVTDITFRDTTRLIDEFLPSKYGKAVRENLAGGYDELIKMEQGSEPWGVINQGDCWTNNLLFQYDGEHPTSVAMIDFQLARYSSFGLDVVFFLFSSVKPEILSTEFDSLLRVYYEGLIARLAFTPSFEEIEAEVKRCSGYGLAKAFIIMPHFLRPRGQHEVVQGEDEGDVMERVVKETGDKSPRCRYWLRELVKFLVDKNLLPNQ